MWMVSKLIENNKSYRKFCSDQIKGGGGVEVKHKRMYGGYKLQINKKQVTLTPGGEEHMLPSSARWRFCGSQLCGLV
jgi:hypothetical protein